MVNRLLLSKNCKQTMSDDGEASTSQSQGKVSFKRVNRKQLRQRKHSSDDDNAGEEDATRTFAKLEETKERQKLRQRQNGVSVAGLALGKKLAAGEEMAIKDAYNVKTGGMVNMKALKSGKIKEVEDPYDVGIGTQFSAETNKRDEDEEMMKYIEEQLQKRKGVKTDENSTEPTDNDGKYMTPEEAALYSLPDHLRHSSSNRSEEMLSNQMLNGIPEVDLGIDAKIKNIEATEEAKQKLLRDQKNKKDGPSQFVPTNMAVNFMQHNRFNIEDTGPKKRRKEEENDGTKSSNVKKATDDYHYDKFKKQFRRY